MPHARVVVGCAFDARVFEHAFGDFGFGLAAARGQRFHCVAVAAAGGEIHVCIGAGGILAEDAVDRADALDQFRPVGFPDPAQPVDAVGDRHLVGGLRARFVVDYPGHAGAALFELRFGKTQRELQRRMLAFQ